MKISLMIPVWKRFNHLDSILKAWIPQVDEILVWDNSGSFKTELPVNVINSPENVGSTIKFQSAQMLRNNMVLICDDDLVPHQGFVEDLLSGHKNTQAAGMKDRDIIVAIVGRKFMTADYQSNHSHRSHTISKITEVDWCGRLYLGHKVNFMIDISSCFDTRLDDLFWCFELRKKRPGAKIFVIPTKKWSNTPDASDGFSICRSPGYWKLRNDFVKKHFNELLR